MLFLLFVLNHPFRVTIQQENSFHTFQFVVQVLGCGGKFSSLFEKIVND